MKIVLTVITILMSQVASASFLENCEFETQIQEVGGYTYPAPEQPNYQRDATLKVLAAKDLGGGHTDCQGHLGEVMDLQLTAASLVDLVTLTPGRTAKVKYFHVNSLGPDGVVSYTEATLMTRTQVAYIQAFQDSEVQEKIKELKETLTTIGEKPVVLLSADAQPLAEGICGFAGCNSIVLVALTYGQDMMNSDRDSLFIKINLHPVSDHYTLEIL